MDDRAIAGRVALVTGASRGLGAAIAARLARAGAHVGLSARTLEPDPRHPGSLRDTVDAIVAAGGVAVPLPADLAKPEDRRRLVAQAVERLGPVDILVNNAAVTYLEPVGEMSEKHWRLMFEVQVRAPFELAELVLPQMRERRRGWILNISSRSATHPVGPPFEDLHAKGGFAVYGMCKAALNRFTTALAAEVYAEGIVVNSLAPWDNVATPGAGTHDLVEGFALEGPEWMAEAALALCSGPPELTGRIAYSQPLLAELGLRPAPGCPAPSR
jgi:citronellol/citronellal dehydrogenase